MSTPLLTTVPPQLPRSRARIAFVGEAPSDFERLYGYPLVGPSGRTFDQILRVSGLACDGGGGADYGDRAKRVLRLLEARADFLTTNVFNEQLPDNNVKGWCAPAPEKAKWQDYQLPLISGAGYLRPEYTHHLTRLSSELREAQPNVVVPLGSTALWALTGISDISLARGAVMTTLPSMGGFKCLPTFHPAHVIQDWRLFHVCVLDLIKVAREAEFPEVRLSERRIHIAPTLSDLRVWVERLRAAERLSCDIETAKQQITCIGFSPNSREAFVIPLVDYRQPSRNYWATAADEVRAWDAIREILEGPSVKTFQNGLYDLYYLIRQADIWPANYSDDTRLMHHALFPELPKSLAFMGNTYENPPGAWKTMRQVKEAKRDD